MFLTPARRREWFGNPRAKILSDIVVALALIPKAIGFFFIAGVDPRFGLYAEMWARQQSEGAIWMR